MIGPQVPLTHLAPAAQARPHTPQLAVLVLRFTLQPFCRSVLSQLAKPALQALLHTPFAHEGVALAPLKAMPQPPQLAALVWTFTLHPFAWSVFEQLAK